MQRDQNNLDFIRLAAAVVVLVCHSFALLHRNEPLWKIASVYGSLSEMAVGVFFAVSGYLIARSWDNDPNLARYLTRRVFRIVPGLAVVVFLCAFVLGPIVTTLPVREYLTNSETLGYLWTALIYPIGFWLPGVYADNPFPGINGSLWTLSLEFTMYLSVAAIGILTPNRRGRLVVLLAAFGGACMYGWFGSSRGVFYMDSKILAEFAIYFLGGSLLYQLRAHVRFSVVLSIAIIAVIIVAPREIKHQLVQLGLPYVSLSIAFAPIPVLRSAGQFGDFSYGAYIYAFPVQETFIHFFPQINPWPLTLVSVAVTAVCAVASWHLVEKPADELRKYLTQSRKATSPIEVPVPELLIAPVVADSIAPGAPV